MPRVNPVDVGPTIVETRDSVCDIYGERMGYNANLGMEWPVRVDEILTEEPDKWVGSACIMCSNGCGVDVAVKNNKVVGVRGRAHDRVNKGRLGPKGMHAWVSMNSGERLRTPLIRSQTTGLLEPASWDEALDLIVRKSKELIEKYTAHSIAFYTSGQLFLEEYHTLAMIGKAGLGCLHMDGNTRLCTASAATAMRESFGCDGQPGSYTDIDHADTIFLVGHNMAATQTVLWSRIMDRLAGPSPPIIIAVDPRETTVGRAAKESGGIHLSIRTGTNLALLNGLLRVILSNEEWWDQEYVEKHTVGYADLRRTVEDYTPERVSEICEIPVEDILRAGELLGKAKRLLSTVLQGVYQSNQATASACQVNNINLVKGMIGKEGCGIYQMNGQPTAQNNRETGCDGEFPGFRNQFNKAHMEDLAKVWNVTLKDIPHWGQPTHVMNLLSFMEAGSIKMLWISGTNPAVSLPDLARIRKTFTGSDLFVVAQDIYPTETTDLADVVLPAAQWSEKTGCYTNVDRTVHIAHQAVTPPGNAWSDLKIFATYAHKMGFKDKDGEPLIKWTDNSEEAFEHWKTTCAGRPCDYTGMSYAKLSEGKGVQWPCNKANPDGTERLYTDAQFPTQADVAESFGNDLLTGTPISPEQYAVLNPNGRAILKHCHYRPQEENRSEAHPFSLSTGRVVHQFHTRTKTGRSKRLQDAAPEGFVQISEEDAADLDVKAGDHLVVKNDRGELQLPVKVGGIAKGNVFIPFHYGSIDRVPGADGLIRATTANDLTQTSWDFISKQPVFKGGAVALEKVDQSVVNIHAVSRQEQAVKDKAKGSIGVDRPAQHPEEHHVHLKDMLGEVDVYARRTLDMFLELAKTFSKGAEYRQVLNILHSICQPPVDALAQYIEKYGKDEQQAKETIEPLLRVLFPERRAASASYRRIMDINGIHMLCSCVLGFLNTLKPAALALHDEEFADAVDSATGAFKMADSWAMNMNNVAGPQTLIVPTRVLEDSTSRAWATTSTPE